MDKEKTTFLICPVRGHSKDETEAIVKQLESAGWTVHWPHRDTNQNDDTGYQVCLDNREAIEKANNIHVVWDGKSEGALFDLGMAFAFAKPLHLISIPTPTEGKSFQNMMREWSRITKQLEVLQKSNELAACK